MKSKFTIPQQIYLSLLFASDYPEQEPEYKYARWYHCLWLLIPIMGVILFLQHIKSYEYTRSENEK